MKAMANHRQDPQTKEGNPNFIEKEEAGRGCSECKSIGEKQEFRFLIDWVVEEVNFL